MGQPNGNPKCLLCSCLGIALLETVEPDVIGAVHLDLLDGGRPLLPLDLHDRAPEPIAVERREAGFRVAGAELPSEIPHSFPLKKFDNKTLNQQETRPIKTPPMNSELNHPC